LTGRRRRCRRRPPAGAGRRAGRRRRGAGPSGPGGPRHGAGRATAGGVSSGADARAAGTSGRASRGLVRTKLGDLLRGALVAARRSGRSSPRALRTGCVMTNAQLNWKVPGRVQARGKGERAYTFPIENRGFALDRLGYPPPTSDAKGVPMTATATDAASPDRWHEGLSTYQG
jgi:hypothetical protein